MSLSKAIIYATLQEINAFINQEAPLDEIDEYGYTPLIQTVIVNDIKKTKCLLAAGAQVDFPDVTGRTALHWAADNNNLALVELLLSHRADANAATRSGQPVLVMPYLRQQEKVKKILYHGGANLIFAQDFVNAKMLGHRFELQGYVDIVDHQGAFSEVKFEGFYPEFSLGMIVHSLGDFIKNYGGKDLKKFFDKIKVIIDSLNAAYELLGYQHYLIDVERHQDKVNHLLDQKPLFIPVCFEGHVIAFVKYGQWFIRIDRGIFGREHGTVLVHQIHKPKMFNKSYIKKLLYTRQKQHDINLVLAQRLHLELTATLSLSPQIVGNCSWANMEAVIPSILFLLLLEDGNERDPGFLKACEDESLYFYHRWQDWDRNRALTFCEQSFNDADPARRASKAAMMAGVLFQFCKYGRSEDDVKAEKILKIITQPPYDFILRSYIKVFVESRKKKDDLTNNFIEYLDYLGIDINQYR